MERSRQGRRLNPPDEALAETPVRLAISGYGGAGDRIAKEIDLRPHDMPRSEWSTYRFLAAFGCDDYREPCRTHSAFSVDGVVRPVSMVCESAKQRPDRCRNRHDPAPGIPSIGDPMMSGARACTSATV